MGVAAGLAGCSNVRTPDPQSPTPDGATHIFHGPLGIVKVPVPRGTLYSLPGKGNSVALTVDDGTDARVVAGYAKLAQDTGLRLTFFCNGYMRSWTDSAPVLRPLLEEGQIFMANHTWSHPSLPTLTSAQLADQVRRNERFLTNTYGVLGRPFLRPPYGRHNKRVDGQLADLGYPAVTMWFGTLGDDVVVPPREIVTHAQKYFKAQGLVIGHANHDPVLKVYDKLVEIIRQRHLQPVHLGDIYAV